MALEHETNTDQSAILVAALEKIEQEFNNRQDDFQFLKTFVTSSDYKNLMKVHEAAKVIDTPPTTSAAVTLSNMIAYDVEELTQDYECQELYNLLTSPHINSLTATYDRVANKEYCVQSVKPEEIIEHENDDDIVTVRLTKGPRQKLGATVKTDNVGNILIGRILHGSIADKCGLLNAGDVIHEINKQSLQRLSVDDVGKLMASLDGEIELKISSSKHSMLRPHRRHQGVKYMKTLFSYNPHQDELLPCEEAGLRFNERDILTVFNQDDPEWWQAKVNDQDTVVGLIPSAKQRERMFCEEPATQTRNESRSGAGYLKMKLTGGAKKVTEYNPLDCEELGGIEVPSYEEVVRIQPQRMQPRPIVLVAPKVHPYAMSDVRTKLIFSNSRKFAGAVPHTSRVPRTGEVNGQHYYFVTREEMRQKIASNQFIEHGELGGHYYGLSINTIRSLINQGKIALITVVPRVLKLIHQSAEIKPYVVFFGMPSDDNIRRYWLDTGLVQEANLLGIMQKTNKMLSTYGHYFDSVIPYNNTDGAVIEIQRISDQLLLNPQWVPATWIA